MSVPGPRLGDQLCFALYTASRRVTRAYAPMLEALGLTYPQFVAMMALWETSPLSVRELGDRLHLDSGTLTPLLKRLEAEQLVRRSRDPDDERKLQVSLTEAGEALGPRAAKAQAEALCRFGDAGDVAELRDRIWALLPALETD